MSKTKLIFYWGRVVLWCSLIFFLSSIPGLKTELGAWDLLLRKGAHIFEYAVLFLLFRKALKETVPGLNAGRLGIYSLIFCFFYAVSDEAHQAFVPERGPSALDVAIDTFGAFAGYLINRCLPQVFLKGECLHGIENTAERLLDYFFGRIRR